MDNFNYTIMPNLKKWLKAIINIGDNLIKMNTEFDRDIISVYEHFFVIAVGKSLEWGEELQEVDNSNYLYFCEYKNNILEARLIRNMREHDIDYLKGDGRRQEDFNKELEINSGSSSALVDGTSTIICDEGYLIGGRLNVQDTVNYAKKILEELQ